MKKPGPPKKTPAQYEAEAVVVGSCLVHHTRCLARVIYIRRHGPTKLDVLHTCDNPLCIRDDHHFLGTHTDNMQDMIRKGRWVPAPRGGMRGKKMSIETKILMSKSAKEAWKTRSCVITKESHICRSEAAKEVWRKRRG